MFLFLSLLACVSDDYTAPEYPAVTPGVPVAGAAEGVLALPVGTPLSGYTGRCDCLGDASRQDERQSAYVTDFGESVGVQTTPTIKVIWLENGDDHLVIAKTDQIYSYDGFVEALEATLEAETGEPLAGRVVHTTNHSHSGWGTYSDQEAFYLGSDRFNRENFERMLAQVTEVALEAYAERQPARIGMGWDRDWDPENRVYSDRRGVNDDFNPWGEDAPDWVGGKDPWLGMIRIEDLQGNPLAMMVNFGMHGITLDADNAMASSDSGGHLEMGVQEAFETPVVVMFTQGSGGDQSPRGVQDDYARLESIGELAQGPVMALWDRIETSDAPIRLESFSRSIPFHPSQIRVTRNGTTDLYYAPYNPNYGADGEVWSEEGTLISPLDEFNSRYGHAFCGTGDLALPIGTFPIDAEPYNNCLDFGVLATMIEVFFGLEEPLQLPLAHSIRAGTSGTRMGPLKVAKDDGSVVEEELLIGFFPGEATSMYTEQLKRRAAAELGYTNTMMVAYSQDHEGYLLIPEDWMLGEYEADIVLWGPLAGEHILEWWMSSVDELLSNDVHEPADPLGVFARTAYPERPLPTERPDTTPTAGTRITDAPGYLYTPVDIAVDLSVPATLARGQMLQIAWEGGDPGVDYPRVTVEWNNNGDWIPLTTAAGRVVDSHLPDLLLAHTPDPIAPYSADQTHQWWAAWQAVGHSGDRIDLPTATYRLKVEGQRYLGTQPTWPWDTEEYTWTTDSFELVAADLDVQWDGAELTAAFVAPADGFRLVHLDGDYQGDNPLVGPVTVSVRAPSGDVEATLDPATAGARSRLDTPIPTDATEITVTDSAGNQGIWTP